MESKFGGPIKTALVTGALSVAAATSVAAAPQQLPPRSSPTMALSEGQLPKAFAEFDSPTHMDLISGNKYPSGTEHMAFAAATYKPIETIMVNGQKYETVDLQKIAFNSVNDGGKFTPLTGDPNFLKNVTIGSYKVSGSSPSPV
jgi:hypothetical protein